MKANQAGLSLVELMVSLVIAAGLIITFAGLYLTTVQLMASANNTATASNFAYSILRKYANSKPADSWFTCDDISDPGNFDDNGPKTAPMSSPLNYAASLNDGRWNTAAPGTKIVNASSVLNASSQQILPPISTSQPATYTVTVWAPYGCTAVDWGRPIKVQVDVNYGPSPGTKTVSHASYASF